MQLGVCAEFDTRRLFSHPSAEGGKFNTCIQQCDLVKSL